MGKYISLTILLILSVKVLAFSPRKITYEEAIRIALGDSYTIKFHQEDIAATYYSYMATKAQFKPYLDMNLFTPSWNEGVQEIYQADGLPVYNSTGSLQTGGNLNFMYVIPTGGNFSLSSKMYYENYKTRLFEQDNKLLERNQVYSRVALAFSQPVFTANKLKENMNIAELTHKKNTYYFTRIQMDIVYQVTQSFYQVYELAYEHRINQERLDNSKEALRITKLKQETGNLPEGEILIAEITVAQNEVRVMESKGKLNTAKDEFKLLIGLELSEDIDLEAEMDFETFLIDLNTAIQEALTNRTEIQEDQINIELQEFEIKKAKRNREFSGNLNAYYDFTGLSTEDNGGIGKLTESAFKNMRDRPGNWGVALTLSYPIADWGRAKNQVKRQEAIHNQLKLGLDNTKRSIEKEIRKIVSNVQEAEERFRINKRNQEVAIQSYKISQMRFENGDMTSQELSIEQERLSQVQLAYIESYITYRLSVADLDRKTMFDFKNNRTYLLK